MEEAGVKVREVKRTELDLRRVATRYLSAAQIPGRATVWFENTCCRNGTCESYLKELEKGRALQVKPRQQVKRDKNKEERVSHKQKG